MSRATLSGEEKPGKGRGKMKPAGAPEVFEVTCCRRFSLRPSLSFLHIPHLIELEIGMERRGKGRIQEVVNNLKQAGCIKFFLPALRTAVRPIEHD